MRGYFGLGQLSASEKSDILNQHKSLYNGYQTMQPQVSNRQPLYVYDDAGDKDGFVVNNRGEIKKYTNMGINESHSGLDMIGDNSEHLKNGTVDLDNYGFNSDNEEYPSPNEEEFDYIRKGSITYRNLLLMFNKMYGQNSFFAMEHFFSFFTMVQQSYMRIGMYNDGQLDNIVKPYIKDIENPEYCIISPEFEEIANAEWNEVANELGLLEEKDTEAVEKELEKKKEAQINKYIDLAKSKKMLLKWHYYDFVDDNAKLFSGQSEYKGKLYDNDTTSILRWADSWEKGTMHHEIISIYKEVLKDMLKPVNVRDVYFNILGEVDIEEETEIVDFSPNGCKAIPTEMFASDKLQQFLEKVYLLGEQDLEKGMEKILNL